MNETASAERNITYEKRKEYKSMKRIKQEEEEDLKA